MPEKEEKNETNYEGSDDGNFETPQDQHDDDEEIDEDFFSSYKTEF